MTTPAPISPIWRRGFLALLGFWLVVPVLLMNVFAQDALPFVVAGDLVQSDPASVYSVPERSIFDINPTFRSRLCGELVPDESLCDRRAVPFVSTPLVLPLARLSAALGGSGGSLLLRFLAAAALAGGMEVLWRKRSMTWVGAPSTLFALAVALTPFAVFTLAFGQTSPWMFAAACAGLGGRDRRSTLVSTGLWVANVAARGFPVMLVALPVRLRQWRSIGYAVAWSGLVLVVAAVTVPTETIRPFFESARTLANHSYGNPYNVSLANVIGTAIPSLPSSALVGFAALAGLAVAVGLWRGPVGQLDPDAQWATAWLVLLLFVPLVWWHYAWLAIPPLVLVLGPGTKYEQWRVIVIAAGVVASFLAGFNGTVGGQIAQAAALLAALVLVAWLAPRSGRVPDPATA